ncbi:hypothetical protein FisN_6Lh320 [Fistulifera solaris]|uniref:SKP1-like protein n=1 Tax=Fistulifera solaris TaxID=1519565 RepID=A0A1Z5JKJ9_FISSO|nr:hypothetical protein FisN_6Lh320 [Fistulifera solaris]|eukprot:GAX14543.1 hypothetical protein FisN_6Lh320 [Fistulifera solaris]
MQSEEEFKIVLRGCDDVKVEIDAKVCEPSEFLQNQLEDIENADVGEISVPKVEGAILELIVKFLNHHAEEPLIKINHPIEGDTVEDVVKQEWYATFINELHEKVVYKLLLAANFMHIQPLLDLVVLRIAWLFSKKSPDELKALLKFEGLTPEQEEKARRDHPWIFEK